MMLPLHDRLRTAVRAALADRFGLDAAAIGVPLESRPTAPSATSGHRSRSNSLARSARRRGPSPRNSPPRWRRSPACARRRRAERLPERVPRSAGVPAARLGAPGRRGAASDKTIVEHTAINPNKAAHIGHLRNAALGDTLVRVLRFRGTPVEVQNYIDDTGVQVADVIVGFRELEGLPRRRAALADTTRFDYYCWDLYARVTEWYEGDKARLAVRAATLHDIEHGEPGAAHRRLRRRSHRPLRT